MKGIAIVALLAIALAGSVFAGDQENNDRSLSNPGQASVEKGGTKWHKPVPPVDFTGLFQFAAWKAKTGEMVILPELAFGQVTEARLTFGPGFFASLYTKENWGGFLIREMNWHVVIGRDGKLATRFPDRAVYRLAPDFEPFEQDQTNFLAEHTGCPSHGTFPTFYGYFDGKLLHASAEFQGICTGGTMWGPAYGVSEAIGPLYADLLITLEATE